MNSKPVVIVTRPVDQAAPVETQLQHWGYRVLLFPVLTIEALSWSEQTRVNLQQLQQFDFIHFSSANAIRYALEPLRFGRVIWGENAHIGLMGRGSQDSMRLYSPESESRWIRPVGQELWDSEALIQVMRHQEWITSLRRALLVKGQGGRALLADWLGSLGLQVEYAEVYARRYVELSPDIAAQLRELAQIKRCVWLLTSSEAALALATLLSQCRVDVAKAEFWHAPVLASHQRVALAAHQAGFKRVITYPPAEPGLKAALESVYD